MREPEWRQECWTPAETIDSRRYEWSASGMNEQIFDLTGGKKRKTKQKLHQNVLSWCNFVLFIIITLFLALFNRCNLTPFLIFLFSAIPLL